MLKLGLFAVMLCAAMVSSVSFADPKTYYYQKFLEGQTGLDKEVLQGVKVGTFDQKINPQDAKDMRTFKQRYYLNSQYASGADAPVLYYICGEATCTGNEF